MTRTVYSISVLNSLSGMWYELKYFEDEFIMMSRNYSAHPNNPKKIYIYINFFNLINIFFLRFY